MDGVMGRLPPSIPRLPPVCPACLVWRKAGTASLQGNIDLNEFITDMKAIKPLDVGLTKHKAADTLEHRRGEGLERATNTYPFTSQSTVYLFIYTLTEKYVIHFNCDFSAFHAEYLCNHKLFFKNCNIFYKV